MVGVERFELPTSCSQSRRATRLRHTPRIPSKKGANNTPFSPRRRETTLHLRQNRLDDRAVGATLLKILPQDPRDLCPLAGVIGMQVVADLVVELLYAAIGNLLGDVGKLGKAFFPVREHETSCGARVD